MPCFSLQVRLIFIHIDLIPCFSLQVSNIFILFLINIDFAVADDGKYFMHIVHIVDRTLSLRYCLLIEYDTVSDRLDNINFSLALRLFTI